MNNLIEFCIYLQYFKIWLHNDQPRNILFFGLSFIPSRQENSIKEGGVLQNKPW